MQALGERMESGRADAPRLDWMPHQPLQPLVNLDPLQRLTDDFPTEIFGSCPTGGKSPYDNPYATNIRELLKCKSDEKG